jgi:hypothetical protein
MQGTIIEPSFLCDIALELPEKLACGLSIILPPVNLDVKTQIYNLTDFQELGLSEAVLPGNDNSVA